MAASTGREWLARFEPTLSRLRVSVELGTTEARAYLTARGAEAATIGDRAGITLFFAAPQPTSSAVLEEIGHALQLRRRNDPLLEEDVRVLSASRELEVKACLDQHAEAFGIPEPEQAVTRQQLVETRELLALVRNRLR